MSQAPTTKSLPQRGDPRKYAQQGVKLSGNLALDSLPRLKEAVVEGSGDVSAELSFGFSEEGKRVLNGHVQGSVSLICQRCLEPVEHVIDCRIHVGIVWNEDQAKALPRSMDPWIVGEGQADFYDIVEEELLLDLPQVVYHDEQCVPRERFVSESTEGVGAEESRPNPFQVLEQLKGTPKK
ncbi:YceD family protein [Gilvimarinus sp. SDUM040013]|uniref:Large ribosomal RNA subunit accumulation protein YceD n=1 Tax=Gilvimarinus gilvus TaxID=3058038 RepID=A0ABU4S0H2_9GAMM|nr:YceD family protein [Gilvimarinus sp. SDUM040013]MDO3385724.1 YceD family protein [Gilvimarinus sp. SDUM040013]MDX6849363.1 YceD family protein [Gilvimarinus sp. SDUM040013]